MLSKFFLAPLFPTTLPVGVAGEGGSSHRATKGKVSILDEPREDIDCHAQQTKTNSNSWESQSLAGQPRKDSRRDTVRDREREADRQDAKAVSAR